MGLWKTLDEQNVTMMKMHPSRERTEQALSMTLMELR